MMKKKIRPEWFIILIKVEKFQTFMEYNKYENSGQPKVYEYIRIKSSVSYTDYDGARIKQNTPVLIFLDVKRKEFHYEKIWYDKEEHKIIKEDTYNLELLEKNGYKIGHIRKLMGELIINIYDVPEVFINRLIELILHNEPTYLNITGLYNERSILGIREINLESNIDINDYV